jgi:ERCC4-type nuclease
MKNNEFTIIVDTREQKPWTFSDYVTANKKLDTGDYSIEGMENLLCIERKNSIAEIANNITEPRFQDVIERMKQYKHSFILIEANYDQLMSYPIGSDIPKKSWGKIKISPAFILKFLMELTIHHNIHVLFCGCPSWAEQTAISIMKRVHTLYVKNQ